MEPDSDVSIPQKEGEDQSGSDLSENSGSSLFLETGSNESQISGYRPLRGGKSFSSKSTSSTHSQTPNNLSKTLFKKIFVVFVNLFRLKAKTFDVQLNSFIMCIVHIFMFLSALLMLIYTISSSWKTIFMSFNNNTMDFICCVLVLSNVTLNVFQYIVFGKYWFYLFNFNITIGIMVAYAHFFLSSVGLFGGSPVIVLLVPLFVSFHFGHSAQFLVWVILSFLVLVSAQVKDIVSMKDNAVMMRYFTLAENDPRLIISYLYGFTGLVWVIMVVIFARVYIEKKKREKMVAEISSGICNLDFEKNRIFKKLLRKDPKFSFELDNLFATMIHNLRIYQSFLPGSIRVRKKLGDGGITTVFPTISPLSEGFRGYGLREQKDVCVMQINLTYKEIVGEENLRKMLQVFVNIVSSVTRKHRGVIHDVSSGGDKIVVSFNTVNPSTENAKKSIKVASAVLDKVNKKLPEIQLNICIIQPRTILVGYLECDLRSKFLLFLGNSRRILEMMNVKHSDEHVVVLENTFQKCKYDHEFKQIDYFEEFKQPVYGYTGKTLLSNVNDEWFYLVGDRTANDSELEKSSIFKFNRIWDRFMNGEIERAELSLREYENEYGVDKDTIFLKEKLNLSQKMKENCSVSTMKLIRFEDIVRKIHKTERTSTTTSFDTIRGKSEKLTRAQNFFMLLTKISCTQNKKFEEQLKVIFVLFTIIVLIICSFFLVIIIMITKGRNIFQKNVVEEGMDIVMISLMCMIFVGGVIVYFISRSFELLLLIFNFGCCYGYIFGHLYSCREFGIFQGSPINIGYLTVVFSLNFGKPFQFVLWNVVYGFFLGSAYLIDVLKITRYGRGGFLLLYSTMGDAFSRNAVLYAYFFIDVVVFTLFVLMHFLQIRKRKIEKMVRWIGKTILSLEFDSEELKKFQRKDSKFMTSIDKSFILIMRTLQVYKSFLPDSIVQEIVNSQTDGVASSSQTIQKSLGRRFIDYRIREIIDVTVLHVQVDIFENTLRNFSPKKCSSCFSYFDKIITKNVHDEGGIINDRSSYGHEILASFNALKPSLDSPNKAVRIAQIIQSKMHKRYPEINLLICIMNVDRVSGGHVQCGGSSEYFLLMDEQNKEIFNEMKKRSDKNIVVCDRIFKQTQSNWNFKQIDFIDRYKTGLFEPVGEKLISENSIVTEKSPVFNLIWQDYMEGKYEQAEDKLLEHEKIYGKCHDSKIITKKLQSIHEA